MTKDITTAWLEKQGATDKEISDLLKEATLLRKKYGLEDLSGDSDGEQGGFSTRNIVNALWYQDHPDATRLNPNIKQVASMLDRAETGFGKSVDAPSKLKPIKKMPGYYRVNKSYGTGENDTNKISDIYRQNADGTYTLVDFSKSHQNVKNTSGFGIGDALKLAALAYGGYNLFTGGLSGLFGGGGYTGTAAELAADGLGGVEMFGSTAGGLGAGGAGMDWGTMLEGIDDVGQLGYTGNMGTTDFLDLVKDFAVDDKIQVLTNMGVPENIATSIGPNLSNDMLQGLINLGSSGIKSLTNLFPSGSSSGDILNTLTSLIGNNRVSNTVNDILGDWKDEITESSPFTGEQRKALGERSMELYGRDYLEPNFDELYGQYTDRGAAADDFASMIGDAYTDPLGNPFLSALINKATSDGLRVKGATGMLGEGGLEADQYNSMVAGAMPYLKQGTDHLGTLYQGQRAPIDMISALNQADQAAWAGGKMAGDTGQGLQNSLADFSKWAAGAEIGFDENVRNLGGLSAQRGAAGSNPLDKAINSGVNWGLDKIWSMF